MVHSAIYDCVEGGFHRYAVDKAWLMPHFEKLAIDNAWHLMNYLDAYNILKEPFYLDIAYEIIEFMKIIFYHKRVIFIQVSLLIVFITLGVKKN